MTKEEIKKNNYKCFEEYLKLLEEIITNNPGEPDKIPVMAFFDKNFKLIQILIPEKNELDDDWVQRSMGIEEEVGAVYTVCLHMDDNDIDKPLDYSATVDDQEYSSTFYHLNGSLPWEREGWIDPPLEKPAVNKLMI